MKTGKKKVVTMTAGSIRAIMLGLIKEDADAPKHVLGLFP